MGLMTELPTVEPSAVREVTAEATTCTAALPPTRRVPLPLLNGALRRRPHRRHPPRPHRLHGARRRRRRDLHPGEAPAGDGGEGDHVQRYAGDGGGGPHRRLVMSTSKLVKFLPVLRRLEPAPPSHEQQLDRRRRLGDVASDRSGVRPCASRRHTSAPWARSTEVAPQSCAAATCAAVAPACRRGRAAPRRSSSCTAARARRAGSRDHTRPSSPHLTRRAASTHPVGGRRRGGGAAEEGAHRFALREAGRRRGVHPN